MLITSGIPDGQATAVSVQGDNYVERGTTDLLFDCLPVLPWHMLGSKEW